MALTHTDLLSPNGIVDPATFYPKVALADVNTKLDAYLTTGYANATAAGVSDDGTKDGIARAYAYWQASSDVWRRLAATPGSFTANDQGGFQISGAQIAAWEKIATGYETDYETLLAAAIAATPVVPATDVPSTATVSNTFTW